MKKRNVGKRLSILTIVLAFIVVIMGLILFNAWLKTTNFGKSQTQIAQTSAVEVVKASDIYYDNYWLKSIVTNVVDGDVPIPDGLEYVEGDKTTGIVVKDKETNQLMLWIPYDETVTTEEVSSYYQNCDYIPMDLGTRESIELYGGFFVMLEKSSQYNLLQQVGNDLYQSASKQAENIYQDSETLDSHLVNKTELAQILAYSKKIGLNVNQTRSSTLNALYNIQKTASNASASIAQGNLVPGIATVVTKTFGKATSSSSTSKTTVKILFDKSEIVIPPEFKICTLKEGNAKSKTYKQLADAGVNREIDQDFVLKIQADENPYLRYVWIPVTKDGLKNATETLKGYYKNQSVKLDEFNGVETLKDEGYQELLESVDTYGGFYMGEAEMGFLASGITNIARGAKKQEDGYYQIYNGEYCRGTNFGTYDEAVEIASSVHSSNNAVTSHLTYGVEWDAAMIYLKEAGILTETQLVKNSSDVPGAKYDDTIEADENGNLLDEDLVAVNGLYGLAGNLFELTQETVNSEDGERHVLRGGSYQYQAKAEDFPMASRLQLLEENIKVGQDIGFRNCLYLNKDVIESAPYLNVSSDGEVSVKEEYKLSGKKNDKLPTTLSIPSKLNGKVITSVAQDGFKECVNLQKVTLPNTVTNIKERAFQSCDALTTVVMSDNVTGIAQEAFGDCTKLESITIPTACESIYTDAFRSCKNLKELIIESEKKLIIYENAFSNKTKNIETITFHTVPEDITIKSDAFASTSKVKTLNVPNDMSDTMYNKIVKALGLDTSKITVNKLMSKSVLEDQLNAIYDYADGYNYGAILGKAIVIKKATAKELTEYYNKNKSSMTKEKLVAALDEIRVRGEKKLEDLLAEYRKSSYQSGVEDYITEWHADLAEDEWVITRKKEAEDQINAENDMTKLSEIAIQFQVDLENRINGQEGKETSPTREQLIEDIKNYVPSTGWEFMEIWYDHMKDEIKPEYIAKIMEAETDEEAQELKQQCEDAIEAYVGPLVWTRKDDEEYMEKYNEGAATAQKDYANGNHSLYVKYFTNDKAFNDGYWYTWKSLENQAGK